MLSIPGVSGSTCDGFSRRELLRVGGCGLFGLSLGQILKLESQARADQAKPKKSGWGKAKSVILIFLQGGPSHLDIWDPKPDAPAEISGSFKHIESAATG